MKATEIIAGGIQFEAATYAAGDLDTQDGWAKMAGSGTTDLFVVAATDLTGAQLVAVRNAAAAQTIGYERSIGATRTATTDYWRTTFDVKVKVGATLGDDLWMKLSAGAGSVGLSIASGDAMLVGFERSASGVNVHIQDGAALRSVGPSFSVDQKAGVMIEVFSDDRFEVKVDPDGDGEQWISVGTGTLAAGKEALSRISIGTNATTSPDDTLEIDNIRIVVITSGTDVDLGERPPRRADITAASVLNEELTLTISITDLNTGVVLAPARERRAPAYYLDPGNEGLLAGLLEQEVLKYDREQRAASIVGAGKAF